MNFFLLAMLLQSSDPAYDMIFKNWAGRQSPPQQQQQNLPELLGPGPHTLVIADGESMTKMEYRTGAACKKARDSVRSQTAPRQTSKGVYFISGTKAFCVPR